MRSNFPHRRFSGNPVRPLVPASAVYPALLSSRRRASVFADRAYYSIIIIVISVSRFHRKHCRASARDVSREPTKTHLETVTDPDKTSRTNIDIIPPPAAAAAAACGGYTCGGIGDRRRAPRRQSPVAVDGCPLAANVARSMRTTADHSTTAATAMITGSADSGCTTSTSGTDCSTSSACTGTSTSKWVWRPRWWTKGSHHHHDHHQHHRRRHRHHDGDGTYGRGQHKSRVAPSTFALLAVTVLVLLTTAIQVTFL